LQYAKWYEDVVPHQASNQYHENINVIHTTY